MRHRSVADEGGFVRGAVVWAHEVSGAVHPQAHAPLAAAAQQKEAAVLEHVRRRAARGDLGAVLGAVEEFARERRWLKVAGGRKAQLLEGHLQPGDRVLELGTYVGYSALVMARQLRRLGGGGRVVSCDVNVASAGVARAVVAWAQAEGEVHVKAGCAADWIATGQLGPIDLLILDHRGTVYHEDLRAAEPAFSQGARVLADNVLLPGAPLFLAHIEGCYDVAIHEVQEFLQPELDDWVVVCTPHGGRPRRVARPVPPELRGWSAEIDAVCWESLRGSVDWQGLQRRLSPALYAWKSRCGL